ncbi:hypothetical protein Hte_011864 [Hypoxylon texense]
MASLHVAVLFGNEDLTRTLLEEGCDPNIYDERLGTPLSIAILKGYRSIVKLLSEKGADHNNEGFTSALIHPRIDEFNLPKLGGPFDVDKRDVAEASRLKDRSEAPVHVRSPVTDVSKTESILPRENEPGRISSINPDVLIGSRCEVKTLFQNGSKWEEAPAGEAEFSADKDLKSVRSIHEPYAVVRYMRRNDEDGEETWKVHKIDVHGSKLCGFLSRVLENYPGAGLGHWKMTLYTYMPDGLDATFMGLFYRMERYIKLSEEEIDPVTKAQAKVLLRCLIPFWGDLKHDVEESKATGSTTWMVLGIIYQPGDIAVLDMVSDLEDQDGHELSAARILQIKMFRPLLTRPPYYGVTVAVVDWNGSYSGYKRETYQIPLYDGYKKVTNVGVYPLPYEPNPERLKEILIQRGRKFESLRGYFFRAKEEFNMSRRVMIDNYAYHRFQDNHLPSYEKLRGHSPGSESSSSTGSDSEDSDSEYHVEDATQGLLLSPSHTGRVRSIHSERNEDLRPFTDDECLLCVPMMKGFDVQEKKWNDIPINSLKDIRWNKEAFDHLAVQEDRKRLILAFTKQKQIEANEFDDFITGKGKSFIILLCGPPGVGKTLTAESVAERTKAPLYTLSASDLGTDAESVERSLKRALEMCVLWKAIMLIDEADVFLEARKTNSLRRNELVSVFLRLLEYYKGILFLTTNRATTIDAAFESRIDLIIPYDDLDQAARRQIWVSFASKLVGGTHELCGTDFDELSQRKLNGREIKSTVKTALMLANSEGVKLQMEHLKIVLDVRQRAADYLHGEA